MIILYILIALGFSLLTVAQFMTIRQLKSQKGIVNVKHEFGKSSIKSMDALSKSLNDIRTTKLPLDVRVDMEPIVKKTPIYDLSDDRRFEIHSLKREGEFRIFILSDLGLNEKYLFLQHDDGSLVGLGNVEDV